MKPFEVRSSLACSICFLSSAAASGQSLNVEIRRIKIERRTTPIIATKTIGASKISLLFGSLAQNDWQVQSQGIFSGSDGSKYEMTKYTTDFEPDWNEIICL